MHQINLFLNTDSTATDRATASARGAFFRETDILKPGATSAPAEAIPDFQEIENAQEVFKINTGNFDTKKILNRSYKTISPEELQKIEHGITSEQLNELKKSLPIFIYKTQITIHGLFSELSHTAGANGYKNIFQNKNKSIGIKYNAIDEAKRERIAARLKMLNFYYDYNSSGAIFTRRERITAENFKEKYNETLKLKNKIPLHLFTGTASAYFSKSYFGSFVNIDIKIQMIPEKNIIPFYESLNLNGEAWKQYKAAKDAKEAAREAEREADRERREAAELKRREIAAAARAAFEKKYNFELKIKTDAPGRYLIISGNPETGAPVYKYIELYKPSSRSRINRRTEIKEFTTAEEAIKEHGRGSYDTKYAGRLTGYLLTETAEEAAAGIEQAAGEYTSETIQTYNLKPGDKIIFTESVYKGEYKKAVIIGARKVTAIIKESSKNRRGAVSFKIQIIKAEGRNAHELTPGEIRIRRERTILKSYPSRYLWKDEQARKEATAE